MRIREGERECVLLLLLFSQQQSLQIQVNRAAICVYTATVGSLEQRKKLLSATYLKNAETNCDFSRWKAHLCACVVELFFTQRLFKSDKQEYMVKMLSFFTNFLYLFRFGKRQSSLHNNKKSSHVDRTHFKHCKVLGDCHFFAQKRHSNPRENVT